MRSRYRTVERVAAEIANRAHGVVTRGELLAAGVSAGAIQRRIDKGTLLIEFPGVYRLGHRAPSTEARYLAAVKACGAGAVLCGKAAAHLLRLLRLRVPPLPEVLTTRERRVRGIRTRRSRQIHLLDVTAVKGIPVTTAPRTLVDLAAYLPLTALGRAFHEARVNHSVEPPAVEAVLARRPNSPGARNLRAVMYGDAKITLSDLEDRFLDLLVANGLRLPDTNERVGKQYVDCRWRSPALTVELDSYRFHATRHAWEADRRREREARARGEEFRRYTYGDVCESPALMLAELRRLLGGHCAA
jgi:hypothetical protein